MLQRKCPWRLYGNTRAKDQSWVIRTYKKEHSYFRSLRNKQANSEFLALKFLGHIRKDPNYGVNKMIRDMSEKYAIIVNRYTCYRVRKMAMDKLNGSLDSHYAILRSYITELNRVDKEGTFVLQCEEGNKKGPNGLEIAVRNLVPYAEHRNYAKNIHSNWKKKYRGEGYKSAFCMAETFNGYIREARTMPVILMLEDIRTRLMERNYFNRLRVDKWSDGVGHKIRKIIEKAKLGISSCVPTPSNEYNFQVKVLEDSFVVNLDKKE
ncbi:uncharacterized protein LOC119369149 [Jatropha curcas]|uniref:uncharacterized protein LOC119369149 n=1 Tax=Jatropha curcas TaxID=180498 RepID=UPI001894308F|nr:uncharacterized protein LOC119369149 [Jatropha curcas]